MSDSLWLHGLHHARLPCPSPTPNSCPLSQWSHPTISSSVVPFSSCLQSFPASGSFQMSQFFTSGGQSIGVSASASVLPMTIQDWFLLGWTGWISLQSNGLSSLLQNHSSKASSHLVHYFVFTFSALGSNFWSRKHLQEKSLSQCEVQQCILFLLSSFGQASFNFLGNSQMIPKKINFSIFYPALFLVNSLSNIGL